MIKEEGKRTRQEARGTLRQSHKEHLTERLHQSVPGSSAQIATTPTSGSLFYFWNRACESVQFKLSCRPERIDALQYSQSPNHFSFVTCHLIQFPTAGDFLCGTSAQMNTSVFLSSPFSPFPSGMLSSQLLACNPLLLQNSACWNILLLQAQDFNLLFCLCLWSHRGLHLLFYLYMRRVELF